MTIKDAPWAAVCNYCHESFSYRKTPGGRDVWLRHTCEAGERAKVREVRPDLWAQRDRERPQLHWRERCFSPERVTA
jgi:hypothetical protein